MQQRREKRTFVVVEKGVTFVVTSIVIEAAEAVVNMRDVSFALLLVWCVSLMLPLMLGLRLRPVVALRELRALASKASASTCQCSSKQRYRAPPIV